MDATPTTSVPRRRFPEFQARPGWARRRGDELFDSINNRNAGANLPILAITQEHGAIPRDQIDYHVSVTDKSIESYKVVERGDFIISLRSFQGGIEYSRYHGICSPAYVILRRKGKGSDEYFRHLFKSHQFIQQLTRNIEGLRDGKMISYAQFSDQLILAPDEDEQQEIADCLTSLDDLIAARGRKMKALKDHKRGLMQNLFPSEGETCPRLRFPEFQDSGEWDQEILGNVCRITTGRKDANEGIAGGKYPFFTCAENHIYCDTYSFDSEAILVAGNANVGLTRYYNGKFEAYQRTYVLTDFTKISVSYLYALLSANLSDDIAEQIQTSAMSYIRLPMLLEYRFGVPKDVREQQVIADSLSSLDARIAAESQAIEVLKAHKAGLMQQLFHAPPTEGD